MKTVAILKAFAFSLSIGDALAAPGTASRSDSGSDAGSAEVDLSDEYKLLLNPPAKIEKIAAAASAHLNGIPQTDVVEMTAASTAATASATDS